MLFLCVRLGLAGHECQSPWDSLEADIIRDEPASLSTNMGVLICCNLMHCNTDELSEQGIDQCYADVQ